MNILKRAFNVLEPSFTILIVVSLFFMHGMQLWHHTFLKTSKVVFITSVWNIMYKNIIALISSKSTHSSIITFFNWLRIRTVIISFADPMTFTFVNPILFSVAMLISFCAFTCSTTSSSVSVSKYSINWDMRTNKKFCIPPSSLS